MTLCIVDITALHGEKPAKWLADCSMQHKSDLLTPRPSFLVLECVGSTCLLTREWGRGYIAISPGVSVGPP